jgi:phospholipid-binding lipoprotein MlaA
MASYRKRTISGLAALSLTLLAGCAGAQRDPMAQINDPHEAGNRRSLAINQALFGPISSGYHAIAPPIIRQGIGNVSSNLNEPRIFANDVLQLRLGAGAKTAGRFIFNSTFGVGGLFDVASMSGLPKQSGDFGQTLFVWGVGDGPYLVSPLLGPSTVRDSVGFVVDEVGDPVGWAFSLTFGYPATLAVGGLDFVSQVDQLKQAQDSSIDFYTFLRSAYYQTRRAQLREAVGLPPSVESPADVDVRPPTPPTTTARKRPRKAAHKPSAATQ